MKLLNKGSKNSLEKVTPKFVSLVLTLAMFLSMGIGQLFAQVVILTQENGEIIRPVQFEADLTGEEVNGQTPTGKIISQYFPTAENPFSIESGFIENLSLPEETNTLDYLLNGNQRGVFNRKNNIPENSGLWFYSNDTELNSSVEVGDAVEVKDADGTLLTGNFRRLVFDFVPYDTFLSGDNVVPAVEAELETNFGVGIAQYKAETKTLSIFVFAITPEPCTSITLNKGAEGMEGTEIAEISSQEVGGDGENNPSLCLNAESETESGFFEIVLTEEQEQDLQSNLLYLSVNTENLPGGTVRGQLINPSIEGDFEGDGLADYSLFRPSDQTWYIQSTANNQVTTRRFGSKTDKIVATDYDGDSKTDFAVFQNVNGSGVWKIESSSNGSVENVQWGLASDIALPVNFDGDSKTDLAIFRPSEGNWYIRRRGDIIKPLAATNFGRDVVLKWGQEGDVPFVADFTGDGMDELGVYRPSEGNWYIYDFQKNETQIYRWGIAGDIPVPADYDGDKIADAAVYRPSEGIWYIWSSLDGSFKFYRFGLENDIPTVTDFDRDGVADIAVYRPETGFWYRLNSSDNSFSAVRFGLDGDIPVVAK